MNWLGTEIYQNSQIVSRNEGKLKAYESCSDLRAWSHDSSVKGRYLREWMKCDMPICVLPVNTLARFLRIMTRQSRGKTIPRCHPDCKSKALLESICNSCDAIKKCLKDNPSFDKYFAEEEFESSHWPCDKCLDALKSIKMFWKIIIEKIFGISISKEDSFKNIQDSRIYNAKSVAKVWEKELVQEALCIENKTHLLSKGSVINDDSWRNECSKKETYTCVSRPCKVDISKDSLLTQTKKVRSPTSVISHRTKVSDIGRSSGCFHRNMEKTSRRFHKFTRKPIAVDKTCETCSIELERDELKICKKNVDVLQDKCNVQQSEIESLKKENNSLKIELQNYYKTCSFKTNLNSTIRYYPEAVVPKPFESILEDSEPLKAVKNVDSEMIITMKNCRNENYKHVSLLQVLHKTNVPINKEEDNSCTPLGHSGNKESPIELLTKVQSTFAKILHREIVLVKNKKYSTTNLLDVDASFHRLKNSKSVLSCSTIYSDFPSSESNFVTD